MTLKSGGRPSQWSLETAKYPPLFRLFVPMPMSHLHARVDPAFSSSLVAVGAAAGGIRTGWECSIGAAATRTLRERLPARIVAAASASGFAASAASVTKQSK